MPDLVWQHRTVLSKLRQPLSRTYTARRGAPVLTQVDPTIFVARFFSHCMACTICDDACCKEGCDVDLENVGWLLDEFASALEKRTGLPRDQWFQDEVYADADFAGGRYRSTRVAHGHCVLHNLGGRGCHIHALCLEQGRDYHEIKPVICWLYPLTVESQVLCPQNAVLDKSLVCGPEGVTLYRSQRGELLWLFGQELIDELDALERHTLASMPNEPTNQSTSDWPDQNLLPVLRL